MRTLAALFILFMSAACQARVFSFGEASVAAYIRGTGAMSSVGDKPFAGSSGSNTSLDAKTKYAYSGEIGAAIQVTPEFIMRLGLEAIQHHPVKGEVGLNPLGEERFSLDSSVFVFNPNITFEYIYMATPEMRFYAGAGAGMAQVTVENTYTMTAQGTADLTATDFVEKMEGSGISYHISTGVEMTFLDNTTFLADIGYRYLPVKQLKYKGDVNNIIDPAGVFKGDVATNHDGSDRSLDLGGLFIGLSIRFYLNFM